MHRYEGEKLYFFMRMNMIYALYASFGGGLTSPGRRVDGGKALARCCHKAEGMLPFSTATARWIVIYTPGGQRGTGLWVRVWAVAQRRARGRPRKRKKEHEMNGRRVSNGRPSDCSGPRKLTSRSMKGGVGDVNEQGLVLRALAACWPCGTVFFPHWAGGGGADIPGGADL